MAHCKNYNNNNNNVKTYSTIFRFASSDIFFVGLYRQYSPDEMAELNVNLSHRIGSLLKKTLFPFFSLEIYD